MSEELVRDFWWLIFPIFGMIMAVLGYVQENSRIDAIHARTRRELGDKQ